MFQHSPVKGVEGEGVPGEGPLWAKVWSENRVGVASSLRVAGMWCQTEGWGSVGAGNPPLRFSPLLPTSGHWHNFHCIISLLKCHWGAPPAPFAWHSRPF